MDTDKPILYCLVENDSMPFPVDMVPKETVGELKKRIKNEKQNDFKDVDADRLTLWKVDTPDDRKIDSSGLNDENALKPTRKISNYWNEKTLPENCIHVYIRIRGKWTAHLIAEISALSCWFTELHDC